MKLFSLRPLRIDLKRAFCSWRFLVSVLSGTGVCFFTLLFCGYYKVDTLYAWTLLHDRAQAFLALLVGIIPYSLCFFADFENGNIKNILGRISITTYVVSKAIAVLLSTVCAFILGKMTFVFIFSLKYPIISDPINTLDILSSKVCLYYRLLVEGHYLIYFFVSAFQKALYCGILSFLVMTVSLLIPNKAVVYSLPIAVFYVLNFYINTKLGVEYLNFSRIFDGVTIIWPYDGLSFVYSVFVAFIVYILLFFAIKKIIWKKVHYE